MIGKKINQLATELAPDSTDLTIIGDPISGVSKKITLAQLGAIFSGAVSFYSNLAAFPVTGDINVIYCAKDTQKLYLWSGSAYVEVFPSQALLDTYQLRSEKGVSNGYASLDAAGKVPIAQLPSSIMEYKGTWNASTNTPTLANGTGDTGDVYICNVAGTVNFGAGPLTFAVGDYVIYSGTIWQRSSGAVGTVTSVAASITGNSIGITGSPITTSGTLALAFAGTSAQYVNGAGNLITFPSIISQAQNLVTEVYNKTGATLTKGTVVYINGGQGNLPSVTKALATGDATSAQTYGIVQADITNMNNGYVVAAGRLSDLDTNAFTEGTQLYLSGTTAGAYTSTKPYAPIHLVYVAIVVRAHPTQGIIEVKIQNGYEMDELHNVAAQSPSNGDILQYVTSTSLWTKTAGTTTNIAEGTNLYYTEARVNANTNVAANTAARHNAVTIGTANGLSLSTQVLSLALASGSTTGALSSTDWTTFNSKQNALTNPVTGTGASGQVTYFNGTSTVTGTNNHFWDATNNRLGIGTTTPQRSIEIFNSTADNHLRLSGNAPSVSMGEAVTGSIYQAKFGLVTVNGQFVTAGVAGDFVIISQTGATIIGTSSTEKMRVQSSGNVSINNTNDTYKLDVTGTGRFTGQLRLESTITDGTYTYTLPGATGTLALTSAIPANPVGGTGTTNYLPKFTGASTIGNSSILDNGAGRVSIGTTSFLDSFVISNSGAQGWEFSNTGSVITYNRSTAAYIPMTFEASNYILNRGNLGLGVTPSAWSVVGPAIEFTGGGFIASQGSVNTIYMGSNHFYNGTNFIYKQNGFATQYQVGSGLGNHQWYVSTSGTAGNAISFTQAMTLNASGNLSVGNTNDTYKLDVSGTGRFTGAVTATSGTTGAAITLTGTTNYGFVEDANSVRRIWFENTGSYRTLFDLPSAGTNFSFRNSAGTILASIASTGAATFSSSVTATNLLAQITAGADTVGGNIILSRNDSTNYRAGAIFSYYYSANAAGNQDTLSFGVSADTTSPATVGKVKMVITEGGKVGIGTTSPSVLLHLAKASAANQLWLQSTTGTNPAYMNFINSGGNNFIGVDNSSGTGLFATGGAAYGFGIVTESAYPLLFGTNNTERMRITSGGNVGIGTTTPGSKLSIVGLPTSSAGLSSGDIYVSAGVLMIV